MTNRRTRVHGIATFPAELPLAPDALGSDLTIKVNGERIRLTIPVLGSDSIGLVVPPLDSPLATVLTRNIRDWGYQSTKSLCYVKQARASFLLSDPENAATDFAFRDLADVFEDWFQIAYEWICAWTGMPRLERRFGRGSVFQVATPSGGLAGSGATMGTTIFSDLVGVSAAQLKGAFDRASRQEWLPTEHRLLLDARAAITTDNRRAVIDLGTAVEVALATSISDAMASRKLNTAFIGNVIKNANGAAGLVTLYTESVGPLTVSKTRVISELAEPRNQAAHGGHVPSDENVRKALAHARSIIEQARPLPSH